MQNKTPQGTRLRACEARVTSAKRAKIRHFAPTIIRRFAPTIPTDCFSVYSKRLMGMCRWMGSHFHNWTDYNKVVISIELLEWVAYFRDLRVRILIHFIMA